MPEPRAEPIVSMTTFKRADGDLMAGEYTFVCDIESVEADIEYADEPIEFVEERWERVYVRTFTLPTCRQCNDPATHWGLCEKHAREDDPSAFEEEPDA